MVIPRDTFESKEEMEAFLSGHPLPRKPKVQKADPLPPSVPNQVRLEDIPLAPITDFEARGKSVRNKEGVKFCGFDFSVEFEGGKSISGWLPEGEFFLLKKRIPPERTDLLSKIGL